MIILDVETSGINTQKSSLLSIGALEFENPANQFYAECRVWDGAHIEDEALAINGFSRAQCADPSRQTDAELLKGFLSWAMACKNHTACGQNVSFDLGFLIATAERNHIAFPLARRSLDLHSVAYFDMKRRGIEPPASKGRSDLNLNKILAYVGLPEEPEPHNSLTDAKLEAEALSRLTFKRSLLQEFAAYPVPDPE